MRRPALRENCAHDFFLFWRTLAEQLSSDRAAIRGSYARAIFFVTAENVKFCYFDVVQYSNNVRENEVNAVRARRKRESKNEIERQKYLSVLNH